MDATELLTKTAANIWVYRFDAVHPAWVDDNTLPIVASTGFIEFVNGDLVEIGPCEVNLEPDRYPSLGLEFLPSTEESLRTLLSNGQVVDAIPLVDATPLMPFVITQIEASDPLGEEAISQYTLISRSGGRITFRHIMPPMTLGIRVDSAGNS